VLLNTAGVQTPSLSGFPLFHSNKFLMHFSEKGRLKLLNMSHCSLDENVSTAQKFRMELTQPIHESFFLFYKHSRDKKNENLSLHQLLFFQPDYDPTSVKDGCKRNFCLRFCLFHHRCLW